MVRSQALRVGKHGMRARRIVQGHGEQHINGHASILAAATLHVEIKPAHEDMALRIGQALKTKVD